MISCCSVRGGFSSEVFCFSLLYFLSFGESTILLTMLFGKNKDIICYFQVLLLSLIFFLLGVSEH